MKKLNEFFRSIVSEINLLGLEKKFINLKKFSGPKNPKWLSGQTIYEIYPRSFSSEGTLRQVTEKLTEIAKLGIKIIWLMPIYPIGQIDRKGSLGSPYAIKDYFGINPEYGTADDFRELVAAAHHLGLKVILDMVANHAAPDNNAQDIIQRDAKGTALRKNPDWTDIADLDYEKAETRDFMLKIMKYWLENFDIDGYRCDVAGYVPLDFWEPAAERLRSIKDDFYLLAEWESPVMHKKAFNSTYDWGLYYLMKMVRDGQKGPGILLDWISLKNATYPANCLPLRFIENHDFPRAAEVFGADAQFPYLAFIYAVNGIPLVYNGQEIGLETELSLFEKQEIEWKDENAETKQYYSELINLRKKTETLTNKNCLIIEQEFYNDVLIFFKSGNPGIYVLLNFRVNIYSIGLPEKICSYLKEGKVVFNTDDNLTIDKGKVVLAAYQAVYIQTN